MIAVVTSIGERTTELCVWSLKRNGFDVILLQHAETTLWAKLETIYEFLNEDFVRIDADVIPNKYFTEDNLKAPQGAWWVQYQTFDWYRQTIGHGGIQYIKKKALPMLQKHVSEFEHAQRPETELFRLPEFMEPRRCVTVAEVMGLHGYGNPNLGAVKEIKRLRGQTSNYDWELCERLNQL